MNSRRYSEPRKSIPESIKTQIRIEAKHCCSICGASSPLEFHHIDENRENNSLENIILLCCNHHREFHKGNIKRKELELYKRKLSIITSRNNELDFYLRKIGWVTDNLFLNQWSSINEMIGEEHYISELIRDKFIMVANNITQTNFPDGIYSQLNNILNNLANSLNVIVLAFEQNPHVEYDAQSKKYYLSRRWKGRRWYSPEEYNRLHQIDVDFEENLCDLYKNLCLNILNLQKYIWEELDFDYLDRVRIKATFCRYYSQQV
jgi:HNH nuclease